MGCIGEPLVVQRQHTETAALSNTCWEVLFFVGGLFFVLWTLQCRGWALTAVFNNILWTTTAQSFMNVLIA